MNFWPTFWMVIFISAIGFFALLSIVVTIGGAFDIRQMLRALREENPTQSDAVEKTKADS